MPWLAPTATPDQPPITESHIARAWSRISDQPAEAITVREGN